MAASLRYLLEGFGADFRRRPVEFNDSLPATVPVCSLCRCVPSDHYTLSCKHVFCSVCFTDIVQTRPLSLRCPVDGKNLRPRKPVPKGSTHPEDLSGLFACCWNKEHGCTYAGPLGDMSRHFDECAFYEVRCSLCSNTLLRSDLAAHVEAAHPRSGRPSGRHPAAGDSAVAHLRATAPPGGRRPTSHAPDSKDCVSSAVASSDGKASPAENTTGSGDAHERDGGHVFEALCSNDRLQVRIEDVASRTAEDIKRHNKKLLLEVLSGIEVIKDRLLAFADAARVTLPPERVTEAASCSSSTFAFRQKRDVALNEFEWVVDNYSRLRVGIHYVDSPAFVITPGYRVEIKACIDGIKTAELSASVRVQRPDAGDPSSASQLLWPFQRTCTFTLLHNSDDGGHVRSSFAPCDAFNGRAVPPISGDGEVLVSSWLCIAKMDRNVFERDYVKDDAFTVVFSMRSLLD